MIEKPKVRVTCDGCKHVSEVDHTDNKPQFLPNGCDVRVQLANPVLRANGETWVKLDLCHDCMLDIPGLSPDERRIAETVEYSGWKKRAETAEARIAYVLEAITMGDLDSLNRVEKALRGMS